MYPQNVMMMQDCVYLEVPEKHMHRRYLILILYRIFRIWGLDGIKRMGGS